MWGLWSFGEAAIGMNIYVTLYLGAQRQPLWRRREWQWLYQHQFGGQQRVVLPHQREYWLLLLTRQQKTKVGGVSTYPLLRSWRLLVPLLQRVTFEKRESNQSALAPPLGASPRLGMPAVRHCSVGPPRSAIHGRVAATPASCRGAHCAIPACGHRGLTGHPRSKARSKPGQQQSQSAKLHSPVGAGLPAMVVNDDE